MVHTRTIPFDLTATLQLLQRPPPAPFGSASWINAVDPDLGLGSYLGVGTGSQRFSSDEHASGRLGDRPHHLRRCPPWSDFVDEAWMWRSRAQKTTALRRREYG